MAVNEIQLELKFDKDFIYMFNQLLEKYGEEYAKINGFDDSNLSYTNFIHKFIRSHNSEEKSIDENANKSFSDIVSLEREMSKPHSKLIAFSKIFQETKVKYGLNAAKEWLEGEWTGKYYLHDSSSSSFRSYCFAYDLDQLVEKGLYFISQFNSKPPKHLTTFTDFVGEFVSWNCNRTSGAVGLPSFLVYSYYFWKKDVEANYFTISPEKYRDQEFQRIIYKLNQPYLRGGIESAFTNFSIFDENYLYALFGSRQYIDGTYIALEIPNIMEYQKRFLEVCSEIRSQNMMTFPVLTIALLRKDGKFVDEEFARWASKHNMKWADSNFYISDSVDSLSNCCRLKSNISDLGYFNSIGGTSLSVGSVKVNTINLANVSYQAYYESLDEDTGNVDYTLARKKFLKILKDRVFCCLKTLDIVRSIITSNVSKGLLTNYTYNIIDINKQYNTIGINGFYECIKHLNLIYEDVLGNNYYSEEGKKYAVEILKKIHEYKLEWSRKNGISYMINIEQIPAESAAKKLQSKDKLTYECGEYDLPLYGNQWIPLSVKTTIEHRVDMSGLLDSACNGGSILHFNIDSPFTSEETAWNLLNYIADKGVNYFAFCTRISSCVQNHGFYGETCPICGNKKFTTYQRVVGFLTPTSTYSKPRKEEFYLRNWTNVNNPIDY